MPNILRCSFGSPSIKANSQKRDLGLWASGHWGAAVPAIRCNAVQGLHQQALLYKFTVFNGALHFHYYPAALEQGNGQQHSKHICVCGLICLQLQPYNKIFYATIPLFLRPWT